MSLSVKRGNSLYLFVGDLASGGTVLYHHVIYGGEKFVSKNASKWIDGRDLFPEKCLSELIQFVWS